MCPLSGFSPAHPGLDEQVRRTSVWVHQLPTAKKWLPLWSAYVFYDRELYVERRRCLSQEMAFLTCGTGSVNSCRNMQQSSVRRLDGMVMREPEAGSRGSILEAHGFHDARLYPSPPLEGVSAIK